MKASFEVIFDGEALLPQEPMELQPNVRYRVTIETLPADNGATAEKTEPVVNDDRPLMRLAKLAEKYGGLGMPSDFAEQHDHYLHGTPKR